MTFVVSHGALAQIEPRDHGSWWTPIDRSISIGPELTLTYAQIYRAQPAVRTVVDFLARNISSLPLHVFERVDETDRRRLTRFEHELPALLGKPNPTTTPLRFWHSIVADKAIFDRAYVVKVKNDGGQLVGLRRVSPRRVRPLDGDWLQTDRYELIGTRKNMPIDRERLVVFEGYDPDHENGSQSPIETLRLILAEEFAAARYRQQLWANGARAAGYIQRPADAPDWGPTDRRRFREDWQTQWAGDIGPGAGGTPILEDGMTWVKGAVSPKEAQYVESRKLTREEVAAAYHIPLPMVGLLDRATYSNIESQHRSLYQDTLGPWLEALQQEVELQLVPEFEPDGARIVYVEFNLAQKLAGSFEEQAEALAKATGGRPWMVPDEARGRMNLPALGGTAAELLDPLNMGDAEPADDELESQPGTSSRAAGGFKRQTSISAGRKGYASDPHVAAHTDLMIAYFERQERSVLSRAGAKRRGAKQTVEEVLDLERWNRELARDLNTLAGPLTTEVAGQTLDGLGADPGSYTPELAAAFLAAQTVRVAGSINTVTAAAVAAALAAEVIEDALEAVFALARGQRAQQIARTQVTALSGFATYEVGKQLADGGEQVDKRWITGKNPRPSHAAMNGQTVPIDQPFSNGGLWPADAVNLDVDDVAGCNCALEIEIGGADA